MKSVNFRRFMSLPSCVIQLPEIKPKAAAIGSIRSLLIYRNRSKRRQRIQFRQCFVQFTVRNRINQLPMFTFMNLIFMLPTFGASILKPNLKRNEKQMKYFDRIK